MSRDCAARWRRRSRKPRYVRRLFHTIADRYDLITRLLSYGQDRAGSGCSWTCSGAGPSVRALDLACGTGDIAFGAGARAARASSASTSRCGCCSSRARRRAPARGVRFRRRRHDGAAVRRRARSISSPPATASATCRASSPRSPRSAACCARAAGSCRSTSTGPSNPLVARCLPRLSHRRRLRARMGAAPRSRHLPLHPGVDYAVIPALRRRGGSRARFASARGPSRRTHGHDSCAAGSRARVDGGIRLRPGAGIRSRDGSFRSPPPPARRDRGCAAPIDRAARARRRGPACLGARADRRSRCRSFRQLAWALAAEGHRFRLFTPDRRCGCRWIDPPRSSSRCRSTPSATIPRRSCSSTRGRGRRMISDERIVGQGAQHRAR